MPVRKIAPPDKLPSGGKARICGNSIKRLFLPVFIQQTTQIHMQPTLIILAAGMGSRYGGMKQLDRLGPSGETIMEYSVYDAIRAGFGKVIFVIRRSFETEFSETIIDRLKGHIQVETVFQDMEDLPLGYKNVAGRDKPWGTGHAIWVARKLVKEPFSVINADDFYGRAAFEGMAAYLINLQREDTGRYAMCGYLLSNTLSEHGKVSRGICQVDDNGYLASVSEHSAISRNQNGQITSGEGEDKKILRDQDIVSMNFWGFGPDLFEHLETQFHRFLLKEGHNPKSEFYIPLVVDKLICDKKAKVKVLQSHARWFGVTYREDKAKAVTSLQAMTEAGEYPEKLFI
jgi:NDP-sugar pyrophosphorylase family protein